MLFAALNYAAPEVTKWQGYAAFIVMAGIGLLVLFIAMKAARLVLMIVALVFFVGAWPARNVVQNKVQEQVREQCIKQFGPKSLECKLSA